MTPYDLTAHRLDMARNDRLTDEEREYLSEINETSIRVVNRQQFFIWSQGQLQRLVPHEILICGIDDGARGGLEHHHFEATRYFREQHFEALCRPDTGLVKHLLQAADRTGSTIVMSPHPGEAPNPQSDALLQLVQENELKNLAASLWMGPKTKLQAFYSFSRINPLTERTAYLLELIVPCLHVTFMRVLASQAAASTSNGARPGRLVTPRQKEILTLIRDGRTNSEIATILDVSPWTIKSHIQMIFQRLNSTNRTQAITRAISLGILRSE